MPEENSELLKKGVTKLAIGYQPNHLEITRRATAEVYQKALGPAFVGGGVDPTGKG